MTFLQHRNIFFARYMKGKLYLNLKCKIESWFDSLQVFFTATSRLKSLLTSTSQESAHNLSERTSSVDLPIWKSLQVSLITWLHFPMPLTGKKMIVRGIVWIKFIALSVANKSRELIFGSTFIIPCYLILYDHSVHQSQTVKW